MTTVLITGAGGYVGRLTTAALAADPAITRVIATDVRPLTGDEAAVTYRRMDIRDSALTTVLKDERVDVVVHLAAIVTPGPADTRDVQYDVDVNGTRNVLTACAAAGVRRFVYTSSGAAYGYHPDNAPLLDEDDPLRGNEAFAYSHHKRLVEGLLADYRERHPALEQVVFRVSTVLGSAVKNQITALFERPVVVGVAGAETPFCFVWDRDVVACLHAAVRGAPAGTYNLTGDGVMTLREIATAMGRAYLPLSEGLLTTALGVLSRRGVVPYGPEQVMFLKHRPVLSNARLKTVFGVRPRKSSRQVFDAYRRGRTTDAGHRRSAPRVVRDQGWDRTSASVAERSLPG